MAEYYVIDETARELEAVLARYDVPEWVTDEMGRHYRRADLVREALEEMYDCGYDAAEAATP